MQVGRTMATQRGHAAVVASTLPLVIAHRGASSIAPENTLLAFRLALESGADMLETDVHLTRDGVLVLIHDTDLSRTTDCSGLIPGMSAAELATCDAGYWFTPNGAMKHPYRGLKIAVPRLDELLKLIDAVDSRVQLNLEIKSPNGDERTPSRSVEALSRLLAAAGWEARALISCFNQRVLDAFKQVSPFTRTAYLVPMGADLHAAIAYATARGHEAIHPDHRLLGAGEVGSRLVEAAHASGLRVNAWTVNDHARMVELARMGVDGIVSDDPDRLRRTIDELGDKNR